MVDEAQSGRELPPPTGEVYSVGRVHYVPHNTSERREIPGRSDGPLVRDARMNPMIEELAEALREHDAVRSDIEHRKPLRHGVPAAPADETSQLGTR